MNVVKLQGRLVRDPFINEKGTLARYTLACENYGKTDYVPVVTFGDSANKMHNTSAFRKGASVKVEGYIHSGSYVKEGNTIYTLDIVSSRVELLTDKQGFYTPSDEELKENPFNE